MLLRLSVFVASAGHVLYREQSYWETLAISRIDTSDVDCPNNGASQQRLQGSRNSGVPRRLLHPRRSPWLRHSSPRQNPMTMTLEYHGNQCFRMSQAGVLLAVVSLVFFPA